ncbi:hypothetical protein HUJ04_004145 [Dendroctonus ponderosae]|nr:hypothetical protein HUJ04_004145 [Dendroctonus ponderosae]
MGLTKDYLRYVPAGNFNIISSANCNVVFLTLQGQIGRFVAVGAAEHILIWDLRLGEKAQVLPGEKAVVTALCASPNNRHLAAGYSDGNVQIYDLKTVEVVSVFSGHRSEVTTLMYDNQGHRLASGSRDTDVIVWDIVTESGLCRLQGHKGPITKVTFMDKQDVLISSSKDTFVKFWDLSTQHCFKTLTGHRTEVWGFALMKNDEYLVTGCGDYELRVFKLTTRDLYNESIDPLEHMTATLELVTLEEGDDSTTHPLQCIKAGSVFRGSKSRVVALTSDSTGQVLGCHGTDKMVELFYFCTEDEAQLRQKKRLKKQRKKNKQAPEELEANTGLADQIKRLKPIKASGPTTNLDLVLGNGGELRVALNYRDNCVKLFTLMTSVKDAEPNCLREIVKQGHHSQVRAVAFSSDNLAIVSGSDDTLRMWNRPSQTCLRTIDVGFVQSVVFVPGDRHVLAGLRDGKLVIVDVAAGDVLEEIVAHSKDLRTICLTPDLRGCVTGGGDQTVKFWQFELIVDQQSESKVKVLSLVHNRTLKLEEGVLCVKLSPDSKFIAVALLDSTVKIFFSDSFKVPQKAHSSARFTNENLQFYLSLYGHKMPVYCMDISSDSRLIATGSGDRNIKIWGMDFGDCHKSIFAHDDSVMGLQFVPNTHYFFTCGKDGSIKEWDADKYHKIVTVQGHAGEAHSLAVSPNGQYVVSCGSDKVLRLYERSDQLVVLQDEQEEEREQQEEAVAEKTVVPGHSALNLPSKRTIGSERAMLSMLLVLQAESILECLEVSEKYQEELDEHAALQAGSSKPLPVPAIPLLMQAFNVKTPEDFLLETIKRIRASDLEEGLLILPFVHVCKVLTMLPALIARGDCIEMGCKVALFLLRLHHAPLVANKLLLPTLELLEKTMKEKVGELRDLVGYNMVGLLSVQGELEAREGIQLFRDATREQNAKRRKKREKIKRTIMAVNTI